MEQERIECHAAAESRALNRAELIGLANQIRAEFAKLNGLMQVVLDKANV